MKKINLGDVRNLKNGIPYQVFLRHIPLIIFVIFVAFAYISARFDCVTAMETVATLNRKVETTRTDVQRERARYMSATCESSMQEMVDSMGLRLTIQERPPYRLHIARSK